MFTPSIYEHAARLIGKTPWEVSRSESLLCEAHVRAFETYQHESVVVGIDIYNLEAEAYGSVVREVADDSIPSVTGFCCSGLDDVLELKTFDPAVAGRIPMAIKAASRIQLQCPDADVRIPVSGPFSIASNLLGFETLLIEVFLQPEKARKALLHLAEGQIQFCRAIRDAGLDIAFFESAATPPLLSPEFFKDVELPALKRTMMGAAREVGHPVPCIIGGDTVHILEMMLETGTQYVICPAETDQVLFMQIMEAHPQVMVRINTKSQVMASGKLDEVYQEIDRVLGVAGDRVRVVIGTGALPYEAKTESVLAARDYAERKLGSMK